MVLFDRPLPPSMLRHDLMETIKKSEESKWTTIARTMACCSSQNEEEVVNLYYEHVRYKQGR